MYVGRKLSYKLSICVFAIKTRNNRLLYLIWTVIVIDIYNSLIVNIFAMIVKVCTDQLFGVSFTV